MRDLVLIDLSSIAHPIWHACSAEPDPNACSQKIVARIRGLASDKPYVAICCDKGKSFRHDLNPTYKANRPEQDASLQHQITLAKEMLEADGFPVWAVPGFEADDLIASAVAESLAFDDVTVAIVTADKDLFQLVGDRVRVVSARDGAVYQAAGVEQKLGVKPEQVRDYLSLVGDNSDNVKGAQNIGPKKAEALLKRFGSIEQMYQDMREVGVATLRMTPGMVTDLREFESRYREVQALITLRQDAPLPFADIFKPREPKTIESFGMEDMDAMDNDAAPPQNDAIQPQTETVAPAQTLTEAAAAGAQAPTAIALRQEPEILPAPADWERGLDPRSMREARILAQDMHQSHMFSSYGSPQAVLSTVMVGRELGLPAMASLRSIHNIEGRHALSASLMVAIILKSGLAEFFEPVSFSELEATYETKRKGGRNVIKLTHTFEMAKQAWPKKKADWEKSFQDSGWGRNPTDMLVARATARLARMVYPDILAGLYTPEELEEVRQSVQVA